MSIFGIFWVASLLNCAINYGFPGSLISEYLAVTFKGRTFVNLSKPVAKFAKLQPTFSGNAPTNQARSPQPAHQFVNQLVNKFSPQLTTQKLTTQIRLVPNFPPRLRQLIRQW
ncbi:MAG: hypothetical protein HC916_13865 [Coleofasciculaceae cyanobacterium SM2_1_6]|nr:hypothetical protein [Coleofasciculaceae cyanobacterium SM2_1_6]